MCVLRLFVPSLWNEPPPLLSLFVCLLRRNVLEWKESQRDAIRGMLREEVAMIFFFDLCIKRRFAGWNCPGSRFIFSFPARLFTGVGREVAVKKKQKKTVSSFQKDFSRSPNL